jgi:secreted trypsin-like serine protease
VQSAIVQGVDDEEDPAVVALVGAEHPTCSGTLVARRAVLTAAHCVVETPPRSVVFGAEPAASRRVAVDGWKTHPEFDERTLAHDIAVLFLADDAPVVPATMASKSALSPGSRVRVVGFGDATPGGAPEQRRKRAGFDRIDAVAADQLRALPDPATPCSHDSGGAVLADGALVGVISAGDLECARYAVFTRVDAHRSFVDGALSPTTSDQSGCRIASRSSANDGLCLLCFAALVSRRRGHRNHHNGEASCV